MIQINPKDWLQDIRRRAKRLFRMADDAAVQLRYGSFESQKAAMVARLEEIEGGKEALKAAQQAKAQISVVSKRRIDGVRGRFSRGTARPRVRVSASGDMAQMTATLWHELRHLRQHLERGDLKGGVSRLHGTRKQHMISLMIEADAFTAQTLMCLREKKAGHPEYLDKFLATGKGAAEAARTLLAHRPYESFPDDGTFARALFGDIMKTNMPGYQAKYFRSYHRIFNKAATLAQLRQMAGITREAPDFPASSTLMDLYGRKGGDIASVPQLAKAYYRAQEPDVRDALTLIEETVRQADKMTEDEFAAARTDILKRTEKLSNQFRSASQSHRRGAAPCRPVARKKL